jgi:hypothetical protein
MVCFVNVQSVDRIIYSIFHRFNVDWKSRTLPHYTCSVTSPLAAFAVDKFPNRCIFLVLWMKLRAKPAPVPPAHSIRGLIDHARHSYHART